MICGRLVEEKNVVHLLQAYSEVDINIKSLIIVGDGYLGASLESYTTEYNLKLVHVVGFQPRGQIAKYYSIASMLVIPIAMGGLGHRDQ